MDAIKRAPPSGRRTRHRHAGDPTGGDTQFPVRRRSSERRGHDTEPGLAVLVFEDAHLTAAIPMRGRTLTIGRDGTCDVRLRDALVSRRHCTLREAGGEVMLVDEGSTNGTFRNGRRVSHAKVVERDIVSLGTVLLKLVAVDSPEWRMHRSMFDALYTDELTALLNRRGFRMRTDALHATAGDGTLIGLVMIDADLFKNVNDTYGHPAGDAVIAAIGDSIRACLPNHACAGRLGGEEFAVLVSGTTPREMSRLAAEIHRHFAIQPGCYEGREIPCTLSIGVTMRRTPITDLHALFAEADAALYKAKARGRDCTVFAREQRQPSDSAEADVDARVKDATVIAGAVPQIATRAKRTSGQSSRSH